MARNGYRTSSMSERFVGDGRLSLSGRCDACTTAGDSGGRTHSRHTVPCRDALRDTAGNSGGALTGSDRCLLIIGDVGQPNLWVCDTGGGRSGNFW